MTKKFFIYDDHGNPSNQGFTADEIKGMGLNPNTIVCPEFGQPSKLSDFQELAGWSPPKIDENKRNSIMSRKSRTYVMVAALAITGSVGTYFIHEKQSEKALEVSECLENKRKNEIALDETKNKINNINIEIITIKENIKNYEKQIVDNKNKIILLSNNIPRIESEMEQVKLARDKAANEICYGINQEFRQPCIDRRTTTVNRYNNSINTFISTISSYKSEIQQIEQITNATISEKIGDEEKKILIKVKEIEELTTKLNDLVALLTIDCGK